MFSKKWLKDTGERALRTFLQVFLAGLTVDRLLSLDLETWQAAASAGVGAALSVICSALAALNGDKESASMLRLHEPKHRK